MVDLHQHIATNIKQAKMSLQIFDIKIYAREINYINFESRLYGNTRCIFKSNLQKKNVDWAISFQMFKLTQIVSTKSIKIVLIL